MRILDMIGSMSRELLVFYGIIVSVLFIIPTIIFEIKGWHSGFIAYLAFTLFILAATTLVFVFHCSDVKPFLKAVLLSVAVAIITIITTWFIWKKANHKTS